MNLRDEIMAQEDQQVFRAIDLAGRGHHLNANDKCIRCGRKFDLLETRELDDSDICPEHLVERIMED